MKKIILLTAPLVLFSSCFYTQNNKKTHCDIENIELIALNSKIPVSETISKYNSIKINRTVTDIEELTKKEIRQLKKKAKRNSSCKVYVDFNNYLFEKDNIYLQENSEIVYVLTKDKP